MYRNATERNEGMSCGMIHAGMSHLMNDGQCSQPKGMLMMN
jgi:hypothetical protein